MHSLSPVTTSFSNQHPRCAEKAWSVTHLHSVLTPLTVGSWTSSSWWKSVKRSRTFRLAVLQIFSALWYRPNRCPTCTCVSAKPSPITSSAWNKQGITQQAQCGYLLNPHQLHLVPGINNELLNKPNVVIC